MLRFFNILLLLLLTSLPAIGSELQKLKIVGTPYPPYIIVDEKNSASGIIIDLMAEAADKLGYSLEFDISNWARAFEQAKAGNADILIPTSYNKDRLPFFHYPLEPLVSFDQVFIKKTGNPIKFNGSYEEIAPYLIGKLRKARVHPDFDAAIEEGVLINIDERASIDLLIKAVYRNRIDLTVGDKNVALWAAKNIGLEKSIEIMEPYIGSHYVYSAFVKVKTTNDVAQKFGYQLHKIKSSDKFNEIMARYTGN